MVVCSRLLAADRVGIELTTYTSPIPLDHCTHLQMVTGIRDGPSAALVGSGSVRSSYKYLVNFYVYTVFIQLRAYTSTESTYKCT